MLWVCTVISFPRSCQAPFESTMSVFLSKLMLKSQTVSYAIKTCTIGNTGFLSLADVWYVKLGRPSNWLLHNHRLVAGGLLVGYETVCLSSYLCDWLLWIKIIGCLKLQWILNKLQCIMEVCDWWDSYIFNLQCLAHSVNLRLCKGTVKESGFQEAGWKINEVLAV